jgi:hydroxymethylpyrimidine pyrophosphatase-like HAD family hydrolase
VIWDAVQQRETGLVSQQSLEQLAAARGALRQIPGVYLNEDYQYSLRAFTYQEDRTNPLPRDLVTDLLAKLGAEALQVHQTGLDTAITAKEADKGTGLQALLALTGVPAEEVTAIGDSEPDLAMFRIARSSFAPAHIACHREARLLGCHIATQPYQPGLLEIARRIVHPEGGTCEQCRSVERNWAGKTSRGKKKDLFASLLEVADDKSLLSVVRNLSPSALLAILRK